MQISDPKIPLNLLPAGSAAIVFGRDQPEYLPLPAVVTPLRQVITRWTPSREERLAILEGKDIFVSIWAYGHINPMKVEIGHQDWSK